VDALKEIWASIRLNMLDRLGNPLAGAFCLSWLVWNFRLVLVTLGSGEWRPKIDYIDKVLMVSWTDWLVHGYAIPLGISLVWVFLSPFVFRHVMVFHRRQRARTAAAVMVADGTEPVSPEEATQLRLRLRSLSQQWDQERADYLRNNEELSERIGALQKAGPTSASPPEQVVEPPATRPAATTLDTLGLADSEAPEHDIADSMVGAVAATRDFKGKDGSDLWPLQLLEGDFERLPRALSDKVGKHRFDIHEVQALLAMRNWKTIVIPQLARALSIEQFDARVIVDTLRNLELASMGPEGEYLNADGRVLTGYFKRLFARVPKASPSAPADTK
jgi:hypothetical protein